MGWSSAGRIFDTVVVELQQMGEDKDTQYRILKTLAKELTNNDWDTLGESLEAFPDNPAVRKVMDEYGIRLPCTCDCCRHEES